MYQPRIFTFFIIIFFFYRCVCASLVPRPTARSASATAARFQRRPPVVWIRRWRRGWLETCRERTTCDVRRRPISAFDERRRHRAWLQTLLLQVPRSINTWAVQKPVKSRWTARPKWCNSIGWRPCSGVWRRADASTAGVKGGVFLPTRYFMSKPRRIP